MNSFRWWAMQWLSLLTFAHVCRVQVNFCLILQMPDCYNRPGFFVLDSHLKLFPIIYQLLDCVSVGLVHLSSNQKFCQPAEVIYFSLFFKKILTVLKKSKMFLLASFVKHFFFETCFSLQPHINYSLP